MAKEYIEREALIDEVESTQWYHISHQKNLVQGAACEADALYKATDIYSVIKSAPTADVIEVTYCRDCTHCDPENKHCDHPMGTSLPVPRKDTDFCSYGARNEVRNEDRNEVRKDK